MILNHPWNCDWIQERSVLTDAAAKSGAQVMVTVAAVWQLEDCGAGWAEGVGLTP